MNSTSSNNPEITPSPAVQGKVQAAAILNKLQPAEDPLEFVSKNLTKNRGNTSSSIPHQNGTIGPAPVLQENASNSQNSTDISEIIDAAITSKDTAPIVDKDAESLPQEATQTSTEPSDPQDPTEEEVSSYNDKVQKRIRQLVKQRKELAAKLEAEQAEKTNYLQELESYKTGAVVPDKVRELEEKTVELSKYQKLFDIKSSDEYQQTYVAPLNNLVQQARSFAETYGIDASIFDHALQLNDEKSINQLLASELGDVVATTEAKQIVKQIRNLQNGMRQVEQASAQELNSLWEQQQQQRVQKKQKALETISNKSKNAWVTAIKEVQESTQFPELVLDPVNEEHNKIVRPILDESAREYGRLVKILAQHGLEDIPEEAARILAKYVAVGRAAHVIAASRNSYAKHAKEIESNTEKFSGLLRPGIGGSRPTTGAGIDPAQKKAPRTPEQAAKEFATQFFK